MRLFLALATAVLLHVSGCAASRALAPLDAGQHGITASMGGPIVEYGGRNIPLPITSVGWRMGLDGRSDVHASLHPTGIAAFGVVGLDAGYARQLLPPKGARPRLMLDLTTTALFGNLADGEPRGGFRAFQELSVVATWDLGNAPHRVYVGIDQFVQPFPVLRWYPAPVVGGEVRASERVGLQVEATWMAPFTDTHWMNPVWFGVSEHGALGVRLGLNVYLPNRRRG